MAAPVVFALYSPSTGLPAPSASPSFTNYATRTGASLTPPTISNLGGGLYSFTPSDAHAAAGVVWVITTGQNPRRYAGAIAPDANPLAAMLFEDGSGNLFGGPGAPSFVGYTDLLGSARTPPSIVTVASHLFCFTPSASDVAIGVAWQAQAPAGARPGYYAGQFDISNPADSGAIPVENTDPVDFGSESSAALGKALPIGRDLMLDPETHDLLVSAGDLQLVKDGAAVRQEADIRMRFFLGEWFLDTTQGIPYFQRVLVKSPNLAAIKSVFNDEILKVTGVSSIRSLDLDPDLSARKLTVTWSALDDLGELVSGDLTLEG